MRDTITLRGAREHNLKNLSLDIPRNRLVVVTGLSGSGKSTLTFDIVHKEGQRQYLESLGMVTDYLSRPRCDLIEGLSPSISVDQHLTNRSPRSTVGTATEVFTYLRVLLARLGRRPCPACGQEVPPPHDATIALPGAEEDEPEGTYPCPACRAPVPRLGMASFSFNKPAGACPTCTGIGEVRQPVLERILDPSRSILGDGVLCWERFHSEHYSGVLSKTARHYGFSFDANTPLGALGEIARDALLHGVESPQFQRHFPGAEPPATVREGRFEGVLTSLMRRYSEVNGATTREHLDRFLSRQTCPDCHGDRLKKESREVRVAGRTLIELSHAPLEDVASWIRSLSDAVSLEERAICEPVIADLTTRIGRLLDVGVGYLSLGRSSPTLSAGEAQRLRLASLLGSGLTGVLYVLDAPTTGLHPRDTRRLIQVLERLRDLGNTVLVVEHDLEVMRAADHLIDIGPGAGSHGGRLVAAGTPSQVAEHPESVTGAYLAERASVPTPHRRRPGNSKALVIRGARANNLKNVTARLPLGTLIAVSGPSGSGKSSLILDILGRAAEQRFNGANELPGEHDTIEGFEHLDRVVVIDQTPIGRTPRSNAATYGDVFTPLRELFAACPEAKAARLTAKHFSFNVPGGRCERCEGAGVIDVEMHFLPNVQVGCPSCHGRRFKPEVLAVRFRDWTIADVLERTAEEAFQTFENVPKVASRLKLLVDVGLGYLPLGQPATTLSGGEAQRVKLAKELGRREGGQALYLLDEPTTGLHPADVSRLLAVLQRLADAGNTVVVIEHNTDIIRAADWVLDLGPEGGIKGGHIVAEGTPESLATASGSSTGPFLAADTRGPARARETRPS